MKDFSQKRDELMASTIRSFGGNDDRNVNGSKQHGRYTQNDGTRLLTVIFYQRRLCTIRGQRTHTQHTGDERD